MTDLTANVKLPGRLGDANRLLNSDPRSDARMVAALAAVGLDGAPEPSPVDARSTLDERLAFVDAAEPGYEQLFGALFTGLPELEVTSYTETITGVDGNDLPLYIHRPSSIDDPREKGRRADDRRRRTTVPCVLHIHGGGMVMLAASGTSYVRWRDELAASGLIVVGVEFRNAAGALGPHPFPAGLNDCISALQWVNDNAAELGISKVIVSGESGGGNLTLATALKAKQDGNLDQIAGVYAQCPYISNAYNDPPHDLPSLIENDLYFLDVASMGAMADLYDPDGHNAGNPLAWPYFAGHADLEGLPPHVISVNELDPLRDEGLAYYRKLVNAGVSAISRTVNGTCHAGDCLFRQAMPDVYAATIRDVKGFADSL